MVDWKFYIDSPQKRALYACRGSLTEGDGNGDGYDNILVGYGGYDGNGKGAGWGYADGGGSGGSRDGWGDRSGGYDSGNGRSAEVW